MDGETAALFVGAWTACVVLLARTAGIRAAIVLATFKVAIPLWYFAWMFSGAFLLKDGEAYLEAGFALNQGTTLVDAWLTEEGRALLTDLAKDGPHVLYVWWSALVQSVLSERREAVVLVNVVLSCGVALLVARMAAQLGMPRAYVAGLLVFQVLSPEMVTWSSMTNSKDILVCFLVVAAYGETLAFRRDGRWWHALGVLAAFAALLRLRFYLVPVIVFSVLLAEGIQRDWRRTLKIGLAVGLVSVVAVLSFKSKYFFRYAGAFAPDHLAIGIAQMFLTPRPWAISDDYAFLLPAAVWHWVMLPLTVVGYVLLWRRFAGLRAFLVFLPLGMVLYGGLGDLQGPRHRLQFSMVYVWAQFHMLWEVLKIRTAGNAHPARLVRHSPSTS